MASLLLRLSLLQLIQHALGRYMSVPTPTIRLRQSRLEPVPKPTTTALAILPRAEPPPLLTNSVTCGYTSGLWYSAVTCSADQTCTYYTTPYAAPNFGCCDSVGQSCGYVSTCIDYNTRNTFVGAFLYLQGDDFYCGSKVPYCETVVLYGQEYASEGTYSFLSYGCRTSKGTTITAFQHTTEDTTEDTTQDSTTSPSSTTSTTAYSPSIAETSSAISSLAAASATETAAATASQGLSEGAQIGIGVGVGIFAAVALIATLLWFRHRSKTRSSLHTEAKPHLLDNDSNDGTPAVYSAHLSVDRNAFLQETSDDNRTRAELASSHRAELSSKSRAELASNSRCYELGGDRS